MYIDLRNYAIAYDNEHFRGLMEGIWNAYMEFFIPTDYVARSGYYLCGVYPKPRLRGPASFVREEVSSSPELCPEKKIQNLMSLKRAQSGTEHTSSVMWWANNICASFSGISSLSAMRSDLVDVLQIHDLFESKIGGDIPDVFGPNHSKDEQESLWANQYFACFPDIPHYRRLARDFTHMQEKDNEFGQLAYSFDKIDAVLRGFAYEICGCRGHVGGRGFRLDEECIKFTGTTDMNDNWFYSTIRKIEEYDCAEFFVHIMAEAFLIMRGSYPAWLYRVADYDFLY